MYAATLERIRQRDENEKQVYHVSLQNVAELELQIVLAPTAGRVYTASGCTPLLDLTKVDLLDSLRILIKQSGWPLHSLPSTQELHPEIKEFGRSLKNPACACT